MQNMILEIALKIGERALPQVDVGVLLRKMEYWAEFFVANLKFVSINSSLPHILSSSVLVGTDAGLKPN